MLNLIFFCFNSSLPILFPDRFPKMLPLNGGFRYPASVICVTVSKMQTLTKITNDVNDRVANNILRVYDFFFPKRANNDFLVEN